MSQRLSPHINSERNQRSLKMKKFAAALILTLATAVAATAQEKYVGYYFPEITSMEAFDREIRRGPLASKAVRVEFVNTLTQAQLAAPEAPSYAVFAKGADAKHLMIVALNDQVFKTVFRARGAMAQLTANIRAGGFFRRQELQHVATFYDFLQLLQFDTLVLTDGEIWSHQVDFIRN
ncbi:MAG: hypothetical protein ABJL99_04470 [Aliishimia sp.]